MCLTRNVQAKHVTHGSGVVRPVVRPKVQGVAVG